MRRKLKTKRLIDLHKEWCQTGRMPECGLCASVWTGGVNGHAAMRYRNAIDKYFKPTTYDRIKMQEKEGESFYFWAAGVKSKDKRSIGGYTELRQNIALLICAMFDEL